MRKTFLLTICLVACMSSSASFASSDKDTALIWERLSQNEKIAYISGYIESVVSMCVELQGETNDSMFKCVQTFSPGPRKNRTFQEVISYFDAIYIKNKIDNLPMGVVIAAMNAYGPKEALRRIVAGEKKKGTK